MKSIRRICRILLAVSLTGWVSAAQHPASAPNHATHHLSKDYFLYIGTYTGPAPNGRPDGGVPSKGIYLAHFNSQTGVLGAPTLAAESANPSFLAISPNHRFLYAISETDPEAFVTAYAINAHTGRLRMLDKVPTGGAGTAYVSLDKTGKYVLLANYGSGSIAVIRVERDGSLGKLTAWVQHAAPRRPRGERNGPPAMAIVPHPHAIIASPDNRYVVVPDLGLNKLFIYGFDAADGSLDLAAHIVDLQPDEGPRHFVFSPDGKFGYLIAQTTGNVITFRWNASQGTLTQVQSAPSFPQGLDASNMSAEIGTTPNGKFLYESNRRTHGPSHELGPDSIVVYEVNLENGLLTEVQRVEQDDSIPRCFSVDPSGAFLLVAAQQKNRVEVYRIDPESGKLSSTGASISIHTPACMQFAPAL